MPAPSRWLLATLLPLWALCFGLHVFSTFQDGAAFPPVFATPVAGDPYPHLGGIRPERVSEGLDLRVGDRLLRAGDVDLRGVGYIGFYAWAVDQAGASGELPLVIERDGHRRTVTLALSPTGIPWSRIPLFGLGVGLAFLVLLRAPDQRMARAFFAGFTSFAIFESPFTIDYTFTFAYQLIFTFGGGLAVMAVARFFLLFPDDVARGRALPLGLSWLLGLVFALPRYAYLTGGPIPPPWIPRVALAADVLLGAMILGIVAWNTLHAGERGRRQLRALLGGAALAIAPVPLAAALGIVAGNQHLVRFGIDVVALTSLAIPGALALAIVRHGAFDIDRLISATARFSVATAILLGGLLVLSPAAAGLLSDWTGLDRSLGQIAFAVAAALALAPLAQRLRPGVDRLLVPGRHAMEMGLRSFLIELSALPDDASLASVAATRIHELVEPRWSVLYASGPRGFARSQVMGEPGNGPERPAPATLIAVDAHRGPLARTDGSLAPLERAALDELGAEMAIPFFRRDELRALLALGPRRSGAPYVGSDLALLAAAADKTGSEWVRREDEARIRASTQQLRTLEEEREQALNANLTRSRSLATVSHDLRQPLHAMGLLTEALAGRELDADTRRLVERLRTSTRSLEQMFDALLDLSRLEAGQVEPERRAIELEELFDRLRAGLAPAAQARGLTLGFEASRLFVESDPIWLARILQNLIANAIRYTEQGGVWVRASARGADEVEIEVRDSGVGIPPQQQRVVFQEFQRLEAGNRADERGLGLGLAIVERLSSLLGHPLALESEVGVGTTFRLRAPRAAAGREPLAAGPSPGATGLADLRVLVIDDEPAIREGLANLLAGWGCEPRCVGSLAEALDALESGALDGRPDALIVDLRLAGGERGLDALEALRARWGSAIPALVVTGESDPALLQAIRATGHPVLTKPVAPARLRAGLARLVGAGPRGA